MKVFRWNGFVVRRVGERGADRFGIELAQEQHGFGSDAVARIETLTAAPSGAHDEAVRRGVHAPLVLSEQALVHCRFGSCTP